MERHEYKVMYEKENNFWWYRGIHSLVIETIDSLRIPQKKTNLLDAGCGTGRLLELVSNKFQNEVKITGIDFSEDAIAFCEQRNLNNIKTGSVTELPFANNSFNIVTSLDVIYHQGVSDDIVALKEFNRVLASNGYLILNLPAYEFMKSNHDKAVHTARRYTSRMLKEKLCIAGFKVKKISYRNSVLFPLALIVRMYQKIVTKKNQTEQKSDLSTPPQVINLLFEKILKIENRLINKNISLPFGLSVFCIAEKVNE